MRMRALGLAIVVLACCGGVLLAAPQSSEAGHPATVLDGVYSKAQSARGSEAYMQHCSRCHREDLTGNPEALPLVGNRFVNNWREDSLASLFTHMATRMPRGAASLTEGAYLDILAFILETNGYPTGSSELTVDTVRRTQFVGQNGPQPLPNSAVVLVVGCLTAADNNRWTLIQASEPVRNRAGKETTAEEMHASAALQPGTRTFRLQNFEYVRDGFSPEPFKGQRVQVKGALIEQTNNDRINVTSLETLAANCA
jgi:mono/diheme cytochrome c family protein